MRRESEAIGICFPRSARQRCLAHQMRNLLAKDPEEVAQEMGIRVRAAFRAPSRATARDLAAGVVRDFEKDCPPAMACFTDDLEACIAHRRMPVAHRRAIRTTSILEGLFGEERRRLKVIPNAFGGRAVLELMLGVTTRAAERWRGIRFTELERRQLEAV